MSAATKKTYLIPRDYHHIKAWGQVLQSLGGYIRYEQERAAREQAPQTAIYRNDDGTWSTADQIRRPELREYVNHLAREDAK